MRALLVDDHALFREGLSMLLAQRFSQVELLYAEDLAQAQGLLAAHPDVELVLLDLGLGDSEGVDSLRRLLPVSPSVSFVVLSGDDRIETIDAAIAAGAVGFIPKSTRGGVIEQALQIVFDGGVYLPPSVVAHRPVLDEADELPPAERLGLSARQLEVLQCLIKGESNKVIGRKLDVAESTVKSHLVAIFRKLGALSRAEAAIIADQLGVFGPDGEVRS
jgi:DNA-binding NarL/FixJ family response regulator